MAPAWPRQRTTVSLLTVVPGSKHTAGGGGRREVGGEKERVAGEKERGERQSVCLSVCVREGEMQSDTQSSKQRNTLLLT